MTALTIDNKLKSNETYLDYLVRNVELTNTPEAQDFMSSNCLAPKNSVNGKIYDYLLDFADVYRVTQLYKETYEGKVVIPYSVFHRLIKDLNLYVDELKYYTDAIPPEELSVVDRFQLVESTRISEEDFANIIGLDNTFQLRVNFDKKISSMLNGINEENFSIDKLKLEVTKLNNCKLQAAYEVFVMGPAASFSTYEDFRSRSSKLIDVAEERQDMRIPRPDPLVIRFIKEGCVIISSWGTEAEYLKQILTVLR